MKAIHLAAGKGTRLRPLTEDKPKPLVELEGAPLLEHNVVTLRDIGVDEQVAVTGYEADQVRRLADDLDFKTVHNEVYDETEMLYSLFCAAGEFPSEGEGDLLISYGDIVYERAVAEALLECNAPMCIVVDVEWRRLWEKRFDDPFADAETLDLDDDGRIRSIGEEPTGYEDIDAQYTGLLKVRNDHVTDFIDAYRDLDDCIDGYVTIDTTAFLQRLIDRDWQLQAVPIHGGWVEVDTLTDLNHYRELAADDELSRFVSLGFGESLDDGDFR